MKKVLGGNTHLFQKDAETINDNFDELELASHVGVIASAEEINILNGALITTAELNKLSGALVTTAEINYSDITTLGTGAASKAVVLDAGEDFVWPATGVLTYGVLKDPDGTTLTAKAAELNYSDITTLGTGAASKAVVLDAGEDFVWPSTGILTYGVLKDPAGTTLVATAAELNTAAGLVTRGVDPDEFDTLDDVFMTLGTTATPASGSCGVQLLTRDFDGTANTDIRSGIGYISDANGVLAAAITSVATLVNGSILTIVTGRLFHWVSDATGKLGITLTGAAGTYYVTLVRPDGRIRTSTECVVNA